MKFEIQNLGYIDDAVIEIGDFTIVCGYNNTGKTYLSYALWGFFKTWINYSDFKFIDKYFKDYLDKGVVSIDLKKHEKEILKSFSNIALNYGANIQSIFSIGEDFFAKTKITTIEEKLRINYDEHFEEKISFNNGIDILLTKKEKSSIVEMNIFSETSNNVILPKTVFLKIFSDFISKNYFQKLFPRPFIITSERTGISLFFKELDFNKNDVLNKILKKKTLKEHDMLEILINRVSRYAEPIKSNVDNIRDLSQIAKYKSFILKNKDRKEFKELIKLWNEIIQGTYKVTDNEIFFVPQKERNREKVALPIYASSSAVKSLLLLDIYIKNIAKVGDILFIDEPELNLHPENQRKLADLFVRLTNMGVKIFITTHSDYLMKEINNLIMLHNTSDKSNLIKKYKYSNLSSIHKDKINAYVAEEHRLTPIEVSNEGLETDIFDKTAMLMNETGDDIYYSKNK